MNAQEEIKARLEVAQLYEEMGQTAKAVNYYIAAAEISLKAKLFDRGREFLQKVLQLDADNEKAKSYLQRLEQHLASVGGPASGSANAPNAGAHAEAPKRAAGTLSVPTPALYLRNDQIGAILAQVTSAPNPKFFPFDPLPKIDQQALAEKAAALEAKREIERAKERTAVESAFGNQARPSFTAGSGFLEQANRSSRGSRKDKDEDESGGGDSGGRRRGRRGGNQSLADRIAKKIQGS